MSETLALGQGDSFELEFWCNGTGVCLLPMRAIPFALLALKRLSDLSGEAHRLLR